jgi:hypothetical protein
VNSSDVITSSSTPPKLSVAMVSPFFGWFFPCSLLVVCSGAGFAGISESEIKIQGSRFKIHSKFGGRRNIPSCRII